MKENDNSAFKGLTDTDKAWIEDDNLQLTDADKALLQEFLQAIDELNKREPEKLSSDFWDTDFLNNC